MHRVTGANARHTDIRSSGRRRLWWLPLLAVLVIATGAVAYRVWSDREYSATRMDCSDIHVRPLARLLGAGPAVPVEEDPNDQTPSCGFRISGGGGTELGVGLITIVATTTQTSQSAREEFERAAGRERKEVKGIGERATLIVGPVTSDAPEAMTNYLLSVLDGNLVLVVGLQAFSAVFTVDQTTIVRALINVAQSTMSILD